jgi:hypothetical protein
VLAAMRTERATSLTLTAVGVLRSSRRTLKALVTALGKLPSGWPSSENHRMKFGFSSYYVPVLEEVN